MLATLFDLSLENNILPPPKKKKRKEKKKTTDQDKTIQTVFPLIPASPFSFILSSFHFSLCVCRF